MSHLLEVKDLEVKFTLEKGGRLGIVGESGAGKSVTGFAIINLLSKPGYISGGKIWICFLNCVKQKIWVSSL